VPRGWFVKGRCNHLGAPCSHGPLHFCYLFRTLVNEQNNDVALGVIANDRLRDTLHHDRLTRFRGGDQQASLAFSDGRAEIDNPAREVLGRAIPFLECAALVREQRCQVLEENFCFSSLG